MMIQDRDEEREFIARKAEAEKCKDCLGWLKYCNAECCKLISIKLEIEQLAKMSSFLLVTVGPLTAAMQYYYKIRGAKYSRGILKFEKKYIEVIDGKIFYTKPCPQLKDNKCLLHDKNKPKLCKDLTIETAHRKDMGFSLTPNCIFKYKCKEVKNER